MSDFQNARDEYATVIMMMLMMTMTLEQQNKRPTIARKEGFAVPICAQLCHDVDVHSSNIFKGALNTQTLIIFSCLVVFSATRLCSRFFRAARHHSDSNIYDNRRNEPTDLSCCCCKQAESSHGSTWEGMHIGLCMLPPAGRYAAGVLAAHCSLEKGLKRTLFGTEPQPQPAFFFLSCYQFHKHKILSIS